MEPRLLAFGCWQLVCDAGLSGGHFINLYYVVISELRFRRKPCPSLGFP